MQCDNRRSFSVLSFVVVHNKCRFSIVFVLYDWIVGKEMNWLRMD